VLAELLMDMRRTNRRATELVFEYVLPSFTRPATVHGMGAAG
jgi:hypothetical protein